MSRTSKNLLIAIPAILLLLAIVLPNFIKARTTLSVSACRNNLVWMEAAKKQWALEGHTVHEIPNEADLLRFLVVHNPADHQMSPSFPRCPAGGKYTIGAIAEPPQCSIGGDAHALPPVGTVQW